MGLSRMNMIALDSESSVWIYWTEYYIKFRRLLIQFCCFLIKNLVICTNSMRYCASNAMITAIERIWIRLVYGWISVWLRSLVKFSSTRRSQPDTSNQLIGDIILLEFCVRTIRKSTVNNETSVESIVFSFSWEIIWRVPKFSVG